MIKRIFCVLCLCSVLLGCCTVSAAGVEEEVAPIEVVAVDPGTVLDVLYWGADFVVLVKDGVEYVMDILDGDSPGAGDSIVNVDADGSDVVVTQNLLVPADGRPEGVLAATMEEIFGAYTPLTYEVDTYTASGVVTTTEVVPGLAGVDWPFLGGVFLFSIMLSGLFKLLGVVLR